MHLVVNIAYPQQDITARAEEHLVGMRMTGIDRAGLARAELRGAEGDALGLEIQAGDFSAFHEHTGVRLFFVLTFHG
ncbi:hypothetical protein D3C81_1860010 [compost metagenome]